MAFRPNESTGELTEKPPKNSVPQFPAHAGAVAARVALEFPRDANAEACLASLMPSSYLRPDFLRAFFLAFDQESFPVADERASLQPSRFEISVMNMTRPANVRPAPRSAFVGVHVRAGSMLIDVWMPSEVNAISPLVDQLIRLIEGSPCVSGNEAAVELALREALNNAVIHDNRMDAHKLVQVHCCCERGAGISLTVKDQGKGFDPTAIADALTPQGLKREHGRGIHLMKSAMDEVSFERGGTEVHMWKRLARGESRAAE